MNKLKILEKFKEYHFEFRHLTLLFAIIFLFQLLVSFINKSSIKSTLSNTQEWYQKDSAEKLANLTTTSLELLIESIDLSHPLKEEEAAKYIESFNIILSQQNLQHNIDEVCIFVEKNGRTYAIDDGAVLFSFLFRDNEILPENINHSNALNYYKKAVYEIKSKEQIYSIITNKKTFNLFVPFVINGECIGAVYIRDTPDFSFITNQIISNYDETSMVYLSLILLGLLAMYFISSYTVKERDDTQKLLFDEHEGNLKKQINYEKELVFTKRIYHAHHKAEKVMGFIKEDLRLLSPENIKEITYRVSKYSSFVSRVIYDMKWYDPPVQTIRNQIFQTDLNEVIKFICQNIFRRVYSKKGLFNIKFNLDPDLPDVAINEFIIWEIIEPLIQNSIDHNGDRDLELLISTIYSRNEQCSYIRIEDNGNGILPEFLETDKFGVKKLFNENVSSKQSGLQHSGYGCYIAFTMCRRCGWEIDAVNNPGGGSCFIIKLNRLL